MSEEKVQVLVYINKGVRAKIDDYIARCFTSSYGALSYVVEQAILNFIEPGENTNTQIHKKPPRRGHEAAASILDDLKDRGYTLQFSLNELKKSIERVRGSDPRTIIKWCKFLDNHGYVKFIGNRILKFGSNRVYPVLEQPHQISHVLEDSPNV